VPPPPPDVNTTLEESKTGKPESVREMLERHRTNPTCASCHARMDPLGFSLENFDAIGQWRTVDGESAINATGVLLDGTTVDWPAALRRALVAQKEQFVRTVTAKLLTYCPGPRDGILRCAGHPRYREGRRRRRLSMVGDDSGDREEHAVSDEESGHEVLHDPHAQGAVAPHRAARPRHHHRAAAASTPWCRR
jgi:hypothetical protein